ncbi:hypothetical protein EB796_013041 [Bugula neritina]|uniref:Uncharacterized protein n=1 Tax=Bugula neritina TaxID=10212 RepID=A0A7J7JSP8_BUGNE|nr:hypothetical protein EB796_013041 [Bugula neritina]
MNRDSLSNEQQVSSDQELFTNSSSTPDFCSPLTSPLTSSLTFHLPFSGDNTPLSCLHNVSQSLNEKKTPEVSLSSEHRLSTNNDLSPLSTIPPSQETEQRGLVTTGNSATAPVTGNTSPVCESALGGSATESLITTVCNEGQGVTSIEQVQGEDNFELHRYYDFTSYSKCVLQLVTDY